LRVLIVFPNIFQKKQIPVSILNRFCSLGIVAQFVQKSY